MINISKTIIAHLQIALKKAFNLPANISCSLKEGKYVSKVAEEFSLKYKAQNVVLLPYYVRPKYGGKHSTPRM